MLGLSRDTVLGFAAFAVFVAVFVTGYLISDPGVSPESAVAERTYEAGLYPERPEVPGVVVPGRIVKTTDGDTLVVEVTLRIAVRIVGVKTPEVRGAERPDGLIAKRRLEELIGGRTTCLVGIRSDRGPTLGDATSLGRVLGEVWVDGDAESLNRKMMSAGYAQ